MNDWLAQLHMAPRLIAQAPAPAARALAPAPAHAVGTATVAVPVHAAGSATVLAPAHAVNSATVAAPIIAEHAAASEGALAGETHTAQMAGDAPAHGEGGGPHETSQWVFFGYSMIAFITLVIIISLGVRKLRLIPRGLQNGLEMLVEMLNGIATMVMGPRGVQYAPFVSTFFLYIVAMNLFGLIPFFKPGTASLSITAGLGVSAFIAVQYFGFRAHGIKYLAHFMGPLWWMSFLILPLELLSELIRPVSLSFRLYGNIFGEEQVVGALATNFGSWAAVLLLPLQVLTCILQGLVFTLLVTVYISLATEKHDDHTEHEETAHAAH